jgi:hypothetical protein
MPASLTGVGRFLFEDDDLGGLERDDVVAPGDLV